MGLFAVVALCATGLVVGAVTSRATVNASGSKRAVVSNKDGRLAGGAFLAVPQRRPGLIPAAAPEIGTQPTSRAGRPRVTLFTAIPATVPASGGTVRLVAKVQNALTCQFSSTRATAVTRRARDCSSGAASISVALARNATGSAQTYGFTLSVRKNHATAKTVPVVVHVRSAASKAKAPALTTQPQSETVLAGAEATLVAAASGSPKPSVRWQISTNSGRSWGKVAGARAASETFIASASESGDEYRATFTNAAGSATSKAATLTVTSAPAHTAPAITEQPTSETVLAGSGASFSASASGTPVPSVQWELSTNGGASWTSVGGATSSTYAFTASDGENADEYRALFTNADGSATSNPATLTVTTPAVTTAPAITEQPANEEVFSGSGASFTAGASGAPTPSVQWQLSTNTGASWTNVAGATSSTYAFTATADENANEYRAVFTNGTGTATSSAATLTVTTASPAAPFVTSQPSSESAPAGVAASFSAAATGAPTPTVQWQVSTDSGVSWGNVAGANAATYTLTATSGENGYQYRAVFTNASGAATTSAGTLTVLAEDSSSNWSGYVATGDTFKSVGASWTVPAVSCPAGATSDSSHWIGIDGDGSSTVEQDGTEADCSSGTPTYDAWYEMYGDNAVNDGYEVALSTATYPVFPGDAITAKVSLSGTTWTLALSDATHPWAFATNIASPSPAPSQASAEWISERPEVCASSCALASLANFGAVSFTGATASGAHTTGGISAFSSSPIEMVNGSDVLSAPGALTSSGANFTDTWFASS